VLSREEEGGSSTLRVLVATDCHLGYLEKDEERRFDSFDIFEEICSLAEKQQQQQQQHSLFSQASWGSLEMKHERNKFKVQAH